jgi:hypothetical protein
LHCVHASHTFANITAAAAATASASTTAAAAGAAAAGAIAAVECDPIAALAAAVAAETALSHHTAQLPLLRTAAQATAAALSSAELALRGESLTGMCERQPHPTVNLNGLLRALFILLNCNTRSSSDVVCVIGASVKHSAVTLRQLLRVTLAMTLTVAASHYGCMSVVLQ